MTVYDASPENQKRFWSYTKKNEATGCIEWTGRTGGKGYGMFWGGVNNKYEIFAHRYAMVVFGGKDPDHMLVMHTCDNRLCVNPEHLRLGTNRDNINDKVRKNRQARNVGSQNGTARYCETDIVEMKRLHSQGVTATEIAKRYNTNTTHICRILSGKIWSHVTADYNVMQSWDWVI